MKKSRRSSTIAAPVVSAFFGPALVFAALVVSAAAAMSACAPPELLQAQDAVMDGGVDAGDGPVADAADDETGVPQQIAFGQVAELVRGSCSATPSCHGATGFTNFKVEGDGAASDAQVRAALEDVQTLEGLDLVAPGDAEVSAIYLRLVDTGSRKMPPAGQPELSEDEIEMVRLWIVQGASYE